MGEVEIILSFYCMSVNMAGGTAASACRKSVSDGSEMGALPHYQSIGDPYSPAMSITQYSLMQPVLNGIAQPEAPDVTINCVFPRISVP